MSETTDTQYYTPPEVLREMCEQLQRELAAANQIMGELCESCGWAMRLPDQPCRCQLERELAEARKERDKWAYECEANMKILKEAIATGTRAMEQRDTLVEAVNKYTIEHAKRGAVSTATIDQLEQSLAAVKGGTP
jgi:hypothetical protein